MPKNTTSQYSPAVDKVIYEDKPWDIVVDSVEQGILICALMDQMGRSVSAVFEVAVILGIEEEWNNLPYDPTSNPVEDEDG